jgi:hypothetical protein
MPTVIGHRQLDLPETQLLSDLYGVIKDLASVSEFCQRLVDAFDVDSPDLHLLDALATACVVRYCRCFEGGVRTKLDPDSVRAVDPRFAEFHDYLFALRQKHLSHSVNEFEANCVAVSVAEPPSPPEIRGITVVGGRVAGLDRRTALNLQELAGKLREAASARYEAEEKELRALVDKMSIDKVYQLPEPRPFEPDWKRAGRKRRRK